MSATLFGINILDIAPAERHVRLLVSVVYFDGHRTITLPRADKLDFFLRILADPSGSFTGQVPFYTEQVGFEQVFDVKWAAQHAHRYIETAERTWINNNDRASYRRCFEAINSGADIPSDAYIEAEYIVTVTVTDPASLSHLSPGTGWGTTVWSSGERAVVLKVDEAHSTVLPDLSRPPHAIDFDYEGAFHPIHFSKDGTRMMVGTHTSRELLTFDTTTWTLTHTNRVRMFLCYLAFGNHLERYWAKPGQYASTSLLCWSFDGQPLEKMTLTSFGVYATEVDEDYYGDDEDWDGIIKYEAAPSLHCFYPSPSGRYYCMTGEDWDHIVVYSNSGEPLWHHSIDRCEYSYLAWSHDESRIAYRYNDEDSVYGKAYVDPVLIFDVQTGDLVARIELEDFNTLFLGFDSEGRYLALASVTELRVYHIETQAQVLRHLNSGSVDPGTLVSMRWVPSSAQVVVSYQGGQSGGTIQVFPILSPTHAAGVCQ